MTAKYHIKDDGTPGICGAASADSCPKTKAGDGFHGTFEEAALESERRFEEEHGGLPTAGKSSENLTLRPAPEELEDRGYGVLNASILAKVDPRAKEISISPEEYSNVAPGSWVRAVEIADGELDEVSAQINENKHSWSKRYTVLEEAAVVRLSSGHSAARIRELADHNYGEGGAGTRKLLPEAYADRKELHARELELAAVVERLEKDSTDHVEGYRAMTGRNSELHELRRDIAAKKNFAQVAAALSDERNIGGKTIPAGYGPHMGIYNAESGELLALESTALSGTAVEIDGVEQKFRPSKHSDPAKAAEADRKKGVRMGLAFAPMEITTKGTPKPVRQTEKNRDLNIGL